jgi:class 3 adenylate cyclase
MATLARPTITTILFTDLVGSTELLQRVGDEQAQRLFEAHHTVLQYAVAANGGSELQWMGDGLMVAFPSTADAVRCSVAMHQAAQQPIGGERLEIRVGLNVGETLQQDSGSGHFGTPVVVAKRLCDRAAAGQILCTRTTADLLAGRQAFRFRELGLAELKGIAEPVAVCECLYERDRAAVRLSQTPFVGRSDELAALGESLERAKSGSGGLTMLVGEPGIGKTRTLEEFAGSARRQGARVLWGRCYEGDWAPPYGAFAEAIADYGGRTDLDELQKDLGPYAGPIAMLVPALHQRLPDLPEPANLQPDEERFRLLDAVTQFLVATARRDPVLIVVDDLHWADGSTIAMLRHLARFSPRNRLLIVGSYRDVELDRQHPLADALAALRREAEYERILLKGLRLGEVAELLETVATHEVPGALVRAIEEETDGNPFFIREILLHLVEEGKLHRSEGRWTTDLSIQQLGIPEGVRQVIGRRLSRVSEETNRLLLAACGSGGAFRLDVVSAVAGLDEAVALNALDEALEAQLLRPGGEVDIYDFTHALIRHTLYAELNPSRQVRLHRRLAEELERASGQQEEDCAAEIARQYQRSAALPGAERGVAHALAAADLADRTAAHEEVASFLRIALELLPPQDARRPRLLARLGLALAWGLALEEAVDTAIEAGRSIAEAEGSDAAGDYLAEAAGTVFTAGFSPPTAWRLAEEGLGYVGSRRDLTWVRLRTFDLQRAENQDPDLPGIPLDSPERRELSRVLLERWPALEWVERDVLAFVAIFSSREEVLELASDSAYFLMHYAGDYRRASALYREHGEAALERGQIATAAMNLTMVSRLESALGNLSAASELIGRVRELVARLSPTPTLALQALVVPAADYALNRGEGIEPLLAPAEAILGESALENHWVMATVRAAAAFGYAMIGGGGEAVRYLDSVVPAIERAPGWVVNYTALICHAANALFELDRTEHAETLVRNLKEKTLAPDFRYSSVDARSSMARLCTLLGRFDEAAGWFAEARAVLEDQGARPLRARVDLDEARMFLRRGEPGDADRARRLLDAATLQFRQIGMPGWELRAGALERELTRSA